MTKNSAAEVVQTPLDADTESRILDAAHAVFMRRGTAGARMTEIAPSRSNAISVPSGENRGV